ncbi:hypothetical protein [Leifsonia sp. ALI-44-B]|uniref:ParB family protein n=1 Tax=Leifsonia sp. ALI-44-B TaxID=1933776 RepID=UPI00117ADACB|nr:hypothetical protein [Leifsonia sp. ALI-44-B]
MAKPTPRASALGNRHPYAPVEEASPAVVEAAPEAPAPEPAAAAPAVEPAEPVRPTRQAASKTPTKGADKKPMSVRASLTDQARIRAAFMATNSSERHGSLSDFITQAALEKVAQLEQKYNGGEPWPPLDAGDVPTGRPIG